MLVVSFQHTEERCTAGERSNMGTDLAKERLTVGQQRGSQAQFTDASTGRRVLVPAFIHSRDEFAAAAERAGLEVVAWSEHVEANAPDGALPRSNTPLREMSTGSWRLSPEQRCSEPT